MVKPFLQLLIRYLAILKKNVIIEQYRIIMNSKCQLKYKDFELTVFVRNPAKFGDMDLSNVKVIQGDALDANAVEKAMEGQDILLCSLEGDVLTMTKNILAALEKTSVKRIIWITGIILNMLAKQRPEYIEVADLIASSKAITTLLRCSGIKDGDNTKIFPYKRI